MAIQQTVTLTKADGAFADYAEAATALRSLADASLLTSLDTSRTGGDFTVVAGFDPDTQTLTLVRTWDEDAYNAYKTATSGASVNSQSAMEAAGWTVTEAQATV